MEKNNLSAVNQAMDKATAGVKKFICGIVDESSFVETDALVCGKSFEDAAEALGEGVVCGYATVNGTPVHLFAQNSEVLKGSLGVAHADKVVKCIERAVKTGTPLISVLDSGGARIGEGVGVLEGYARLLGGCAMLEGEVPHICVVKGNCVGAMATYAAMADFVFMSKDAVMSVNSPMYLMSGTNNFPVKYNEMLGFSNYGKGSDAAQFVYTDAADLSAQLAKLLDVLTSNECECEDDPNRVDDAITASSAAQNKIISLCDADTVIDYCPQYGENVKCAFGRVNGLSVAVLATEGDYMDEASLDKATEFIYKADGYALPLITLVDTMGVNFTLEQELGGASKKTAALVRAIADYDGEKIGVAIGKAIGFGYTALMSKGLGFGYTLATSDSVVSPISDAAAVSVLMADQIVGKSQKEVDASRKKLEKKYSEMNANPLIAAKEGYLDNVIEPSNLRPYISSALLMLLGL